MLDRYDPRWDVDSDRGDSLDRHRGSRGTGDPQDTRDHGPRDVFTKDLDLPRGRERRPVRERDHVYEINGSESRVLGTIGTVQGSALRFDRARARPSGLDGACAQLADGQLRDGRGVMTLIGPILTIDLESKRR